MSRAQIRDYFKKKDKRAGRLATIHNIYFFNNLMTEIREAIKSNKLSKLESQYLRFY
jgi:queuine tRNA-ribosyltransferase